MQYSITNSNYTSKSVTEGFKGSVWSMWTKVQYISKLCPYGSHTCTCTLTLAHTHIQWQCRSIYLLAQVQTEALGTERPALGLVTCLILISRPRKILLSKDLLFSPCLNSLLQTRVKMNYEGSSPWPGVSKAHGADRCMQISHIQSSLD